MWPGGPHEVLPINFGSNPLFIAPIDSMIKGLVSEPEPSFSTVDSSATSEQKQSELINRDSGSACCIPIQWKYSSENKDLLLGISHRKTRRGIGKTKMYNYVSRMYAFEPKPPFNIVARSGFFCLGFEIHGDQASTSTMIDHIQNEQVWGAANNYKLQIHDQVFDCPRIHFVTGIAEKVGDHETVIVSYGVNDCYPRMIQISKEFLISLLMLSKKVDP
jgi:hypothetical protein